MRIDKQHYGVTSEGVEIVQYNLSNDRGMQVSILNLGCIITKILVPDKNGLLDNVVLSLKDCKAYELNSPFMGCVVGRYAGRIRDACLNIKGDVYELDQNQGSHCLHGGFKGFGRVVWDVELDVHDAMGEIKLKYTSIDGEGGFPGNLDVTTYYRLFENNSFEITYEAVSDKRTAVSLTNHSYFNLAGDNQSIKGHKLRINCNQVAELDKDLLPTGRMLSLKNLRIDTDNALAIGELMEGLGKISSFEGIDHPFKVKKGVLSGFLPAIEYYHWGSGRKLAVYTDTPYVNVYSGNYLNKDIVLKGGKSAVKHGGICFETQEQPDGPNNLDMGYEFLDAGKLYRRSTVLVFSVE